MPQSATEHAMAQVYRPLEANREEIRLLKLLPLDTSKLTDETLKCELIYRFLDEPGEYECLSYAWGKPEFTEEIQVDGNQLHITKNLDIALRHLRLKNEPRILWVDALCINQVDIGERNHQVTLMKRIYQCCRRDIAWLGPTESDENKREEMVQQAFDMMQKMGSKKAEDLFSEINSYDPDYPDGKKVKLMKWNQKMALDLAFRSSALWKRVWVVQELACSGEVTLVYGRHTLDWKHLSDFLGDRPYADAFHAPFGHGDDGPVLTSILGTALSIEHQRGIMRDIEKGYESSLLDVLARFKYALATDPRDRIYGLLGLVTEKHGIRVDYMRSREQVYTEVGQWFIDSRGDLDIICQNPWQTDNPKERPSWVPDFDNENYLGNLQQLSGLLFAQRSIFAAGRPGCETPAVLEDGIFLRAKGCVLGRLGSGLRIEGIAEEGRFRQRYGWVSRFLAPREWMLAHFETSLLEDTTTLYLGKETRLRAFWRTLVMDCKAYPIQRLDEGEIEADEQRWRQMLQLEDPQEKDRLDDGVFELSRGIVSFDMWSRSYASWSFATTDNGYFVMVRNGAREGDIVAVLDGGKVPVLLREADTGQHQGREKSYTVVNPVYVHGFMDGEAVAMAEEGTIEEQVFWLD